MSCDANCWSAVTAIGTWVLAGFTLVAVWYQVRETTRSQRAAALDGFRVRWESDTMRRYRKRLATALLDGMSVESIPAASIEDVVNFFEDLGGELKEKTFTLRQVWRVFWDDAEHYWYIIGQHYKERCRAAGEGASSYEDYKDMIDSLEKYERKQPEPGVIPPSKNSLTNFLRVETTLDAPFALSSGRPV